jgi:hypothetical protein
MLLLQSLHWLDDSIVVSPSVAVVSYPQIVAASSVFVLGFYAPPNLAATFVIEIFSAKCAVTIFFQKREYYFIGFDYSLIQCSS